VGAYQKKAFRVRRACCVRVRFASERASDPFPARTHGVCRLPSTNPIPDRVLWKRDDITIWRQKRTYCMATDMAVTDEEEYNAQLFLKKKETNISLLLLKKEIDISVSHQKYYSKRALFLTKFIRQYSSTYYVGQHEHYCHSTATVRALQYL
jgi:hypothetical protein